MSKLSLKVLIPQISPINWTLIVICITIFISLTISNIPKTNKITDHKKKTNLKKKTIKW